MLRVVLDTVVFVRALINLKSRSGRLLLEYADQYQIIFSKETAQELLQVIQRPELTAKYHSLSRLSPKQIIQLLAQAEAVEIEPPPKIVRDPHDDMFIATALAARAKYLVSEDKDLLVLERVGTVEIINTQTFMDLLKAGADS